jgi:FtsH-binding integral membrane protein
METEKKYPIMNNYENQQNNQSVDEINNYPHQHQNHELNQHNNQTVEEINNNPSQHQIQAQNQQNNQSVYPSNNNPNQHQLHGQDINNINQPCSLEVRQNNLEQKGKENPEQNNESEHEDDKIKKEIRLGFIKKVYAILSAQLLITLIFICLTFIDSVSKFLLDTLPIFYTCIGISIIILIALMCFKKIARKSPINYLLSIAFTFCQSWMLATCSATYDKNTVLIAIVLTAAVTISLTIYAANTKTDFTFMIGMLFAGSCIMILMGIFFLIFGLSRANFPLLNIFYCGLGALFYSMYLIFDTQLIMGKFGIEYNIDDYIIAALMLYIDIINLFLYILSMLGSK